MKSIQHIYNEVGTIFSWLGSTFPLRVLSLAINIADIFFDCKLPKHKIAMQKATGWLHKREHKYKSLITYTSATTRINIMIGVFFRYMYGILIIKRRWLWYLIFTQVLNSIFWGLKAPIHYLNWCWIIANPTPVQFNSPQVVLDYHSSTAFFFSYFIMKSIVCVFLFHIYDIMPSYLYQCWNSRVGPYIQECGWLPTLLGFSMW